MIVGCIHFCSFFKFLYFQNIFARVFVSDGKGETVEGKNYFPGLLGKLGIYLGPFDACFSSRIRKATARQHNSP